MIETISAGSTTVILTGSHTNFAIFLMTYPHLKKNVEHIYIMGGGVRSTNPTGCCPKNATKSCTPQQCGDHGNLFTCYATNPNAEFNIFGDPFSAYQVYKSQISKLLYSFRQRKVIAPFSLNFEKGLLFHLHFHIMSSSTIWPVALPLISREKGKIVSHVSSFLDCLFSTAIFFCRIINCVLVN